MLALGFLPNAILANPSTKEEWSFRANIHLGSFDHSDNQNGKDTLSSYQKVKDISEIPGSSTTFEIIGKLSSEYRQEIYIALPPIGSAYHAYFNGVHLKTLGKPANSIDKENAYKRSQSFKVQLNPGANILRIIGSNHHFSAGANLARSPVRLSDHDRLSKVNLLDIFVFGVVFSMGMYHLYIWLFQRHRKSMLFFGLSCFAFALRILVTSEGDVFHEMLPFAVPAVQLAVVEYFSIIAIVALFPLFVFYSFPGYVKSTYIKVNLLACLSYLSLVVFTDYNVYRNFLFGLHILVIAMCLHLAYALVHSSLNREQGSWILTTGSVFLFGLTAIDIFGITTFIGVAMPSSYGMFIFIFFQSAVVAKQYNYSYKSERLARREVANLNQELNIKNKQLATKNFDLEQSIYERTKQISSIMKYAPIGILVLEHKDLLIRAPYSKHIENFFDRDSFASSNLVDLIHKKFDVDIHFMHNLAAILRSSINNSALTFDVNLHHLPSELKSRDNAYFRFTWSTVVDESDRIERIILIIEDISDFKSAAEMAKAKVEEDMIINELLDHPEQTLTQLISEMCEVVAELSRMLDRRHEKTVRDRMMLTAHTLKGSTATLGLKRIALALHNFEQALDPNGGNSKDIVFENNLSAKDTLDALHHLVMTYRHVYTKRIGRSLEPTVSITQKLADSIIIAAKNNTIDFEELQKSLAVDLKNLANDCLSKRFTIAEILEIRAPAVDIEANGYIDYSTAQLFGKVFNHLLNNAMHHGFSGQGQSKQNTGLITLKLSETSIGTTITFGDNGNGLDLKQLARRSKIEWHGELTEHERTKLAEKVFSSGVSTSQTVSSIAGRGVGLAAVRQMIEERQGYIRIHLLDPSERPKFVFHIFIPNSSISIDRGA